VYDRIDQNPASVILVNLFHTLVYALSPKLQTAAQAKNALKARVLLTFERSEKLHDEELVTKHHRENRKMRKRDKERIAKNIEVENEPKQGRPISVRPYDEDHGKLEEIAKETGENKAAIVRRMIHFALNDRLKQFAVGQCQMKLDWLVSKGRDSESVNLSLRDNIIDIRDRVERMESELETVHELLHITRSLATEIYSMSSMSISSMNLVFTKLIEFASPDTKDRKDSVVIASTAMAELIDHAVTDLKKCLLFHEHVVSDERDERSYLGTKVEVLKKRIESMPKFQNQQADPS